MKARAMPPGGKILEATFASPAGQLKCFHFSGTQNFTTRLVPGPAAALWIGDPVVIGLSPPAQLRDAAGQKLAVYGPHSSAPSPPSGPVSRAARSHEACLTESAFELLGLAPGGLLTILGFPDGVE